MNNTILLVEAEPVSSNTQWVIVIRMWEKCWKRKKIVRVVVLLVVVAGMRRWKVVEDQPGPHPLPACRGHLALGSYRGHQCQFELKRMSYHKRRRPAPESGKGLNQGCRVPEVQAWSRLVSLAANETDCS